MARRRGSASRTVAEVRLVKDLRKSVRLGHPWIYDRALAPLPRDVQPGSPVRVICRGRDLAVGFADPGAAIAVRVLDVLPARGDSLAIGDPGWAAERAWRAGRARAEAPALRATNAMRLIHGENDAMPGLVIDLYDDTAVVAFDGDGAGHFWYPRMTAVLDGLARAGFEPPRVWTRGSRAARSSASHPAATAHALRGATPPPALEIHEHGARFEVDVHHGQKTGFFLDHRSNRVRVAELVTGRSGGADVLNLFAYTGGFSIHAALAGARRVTSVDIAAPAIAAARRNLAHNQLDPARHDLVTADCFAYLERAVRRGERHDLVIVDPPSFSPSQRTRQRALESYRRLNRLAAEVTAPGGWLVSASCSSHITRGDLIDDILARASERSGRGLRVIEIRGASSDHPTRPGFPEGAYLDLAIAAVS